MSNESKPQDATTPKQGGFGAFSEQYRDRWAAKHPKATKTSSNGTAGPSSAPDAPPADAALPEPDTQA